MRSTLALRTTQLTAAAGGGGGELLAAWELVEIKPSRRYRRGTGSEDRGGVKRRGGGGEGLGVCLDGLHVLPDHPLARFPRLILKPNLDTTKPKNTPISSKNVEQGDADHAIRDCSNGVRGSRRIKEGNHDVEDLYLLPELVGLLVNELLRDSSLLPGEA